MARSAPLAVFAQLSMLTAMGDAIAVTADDKVITVTLPGLGSRLSALGPLADRGQRRYLLAGLHEGLRVADLSLQFQVSRRVVGRLGPESQPTLLSRLLGLGAVEVHIIPCLLAMLRVYSRSRLASPSAPFLTTLFALRRTAPWDRRLRRSSGLQHN